MSFKVGDRVKLTGIGWPKSGVATALPQRGLVVTISKTANAAPWDRDWFYVHEHTGRLYLPSESSDVWGATLVTEDVPVTDEPPTPKNPRTEGLEQAISLIDGDREGVYGDPLVSHERIGKLWSALLGVEINAHQVAMMMAAMKLSRLAGQAEHKDSWIDLAGYAGLGYEFVVRGE